MYMCICIRYKAREICVYIYTCRLILLPWQITELELLVSVTKGMGNNIQGAIVGWVELYASNWFITSWTSSFLILQPIENPIFAPIYIYYAFHIIYIYLFTTYSNWPKWHKRLALATTILRCSHIGHLWRSQRYWSDQAEKQQFDVENPSVSVDHFPETIGFPHLSHLDVSLP